MKREELKFEDWGAIWLNYKKEFVKESTYANYLTAMANHIIPAFQGMKIEEISNRVIQKTILMWSKSGRRNQCGGLAVKTIKDMVVILKMCLKDYEEFYELDSKSRTVKYPVQNRSNEIEVWSREQQDFVMRLIRENLGNETLGYAISLCTGIRIGDDDDKIRLNQRKPSKYKGLSRFGPEKNLQRINKFMKERPTFYKKLIQMKENFRFYLRCFYCITKVVILQFNSEKQDRISS